LGSFFNVCIYRIPRGKSILYPPSHCPKCGTPLKVYDNIPVLSYIFLKGKCRYCKSKISFFYPLVELLTGFLYLLTYIVFSYKDLLDLFFIYIFVSLLIIITFIDLEHMIIPDILVIPGIIIFFFYSFLGINSLFLDKLLGGFIGGLIIFLIVFLSRGGMGIGDIKLSIMLGLFLGIKYLFVALILSFIIGGIVGIILLVFKIKDRKDPIPFGPFLSIGGLIALFWGDVILKIWGWY